MKILFIVPSYKPAYCYGGTTVVVSQLAETLILQGHEVTVYTTNANGKENLPVITNKPVTVEGVNVIYFDRLTGDPSSISPALWLKFWKTGKTFDIVHLHSWWNILVIVAALICKIKSIIYVLSPHGMLGKYTFNNQHVLLKKALHQLIGKRLLKQSYLHATTNMEWKECMDIHRHWNGFIAFNLVALPTIKIKRKSNPVFTIGFLSRIDPKKGLESVIKALANITFDFRLMIAGAGNEEYLSFLRTLIKDLNLYDKVEWCGWKQGEEKFRFLESIDLLALSSFNENFALVVIESLALGTPVLVSEHVGLAEYVKEKHLGWTCTTNVHSIQNEITSIFTNTIALNRIQMMAPTIIAEDFRSETLAKEYLTNYISILNSTNQSII